MLSNIFGLLIPSFSCTSREAVLIFGPGLDKDTLQFQETTHPQNWYKKIMPPRRPLTYSDIDWNMLWRNARKQKSWEGKKVEDWDRNARSFADRNADSPYASLILSHLPLDMSMTVLDVGAGPGTLTLPLAERVVAVTAIDYSQQMLAILTKRAQQKKLANIRAINCAWEDDWKIHNVGIYDLAIASRSLGVDDLSGALKKLNDHAGKFVFITDRIAPTPFDPAAFKAIGRPFDSGPDYIYTVNTLYSMGIHPCIDILQLERDLVFQNMEEALASYTWMFNDISLIEHDRLQSYLSSRILVSEKNSLVLRREFPPRWAMIWWKKMEDSSNIV
jgi:SAM-dependent methyltransferase